MSTHGTPLSPVDEAWLRMDSETNAMVITALMQFDAPLSREELDRVIDLLLANARFRQRVVFHPLMAPRWEDDPMFDRALHVHRVALPSPGGDAALAEFISDRMATPLDRTRSLWEIHVVEGAGRGATIVVRIHHAMGDGVALVKMMLSMLGLTEIRPEDVGVRPSAPPAHVGDVARQVADLTKALGKLLLLPFDPPTPLKGTQSRRKRVAWSAPMPLADVKRVAMALGAKLNDVLMGAVAGALREYLTARSAMTDGLEVHAVVPVFFRGAGAGGGGLGNHFGLVFLALPLGEADPIARVRLATERMNAIKATPEASVSFAILAAAGLASIEIERIVVDLFSRKGSLLVTNVPGPPVPLQIVGKTLERMMVWAPTSGHIGVGISLLSYAGNVNLGIAADAALVPEPAQLVEAYEHEMRVLVERTR